MNIIDYIPQGHENAITREQLVLITGLPDRTIRKLIEIAREQYCIINHQDGTGYFQPEPDDEKSTKMWIHQEEARARRVLNGTKGAKDFLNSHTE